MEARKANLEEARRNLDAADGAPPRRRRDDRRRAAGQDAGLAGGARPADRAGAGPGDPRRARDGGGRPGHDSRRRRRRCPKSSRSIGSRRASTSSSRARAPSGRIWPPGASRRRPREQHIQSVRAEGLPKLFAIGSLNRTYYYNPASAPYSDNYAGAILLAHPRLHGPGHRLQHEEGEGRGGRRDGRGGDGRRTRSPSTSGRATTRSRRRRRRCGRRETSWRARRQSAEVEQGRYKAGVGSILDLLSAQAALANARAQDVEARSFWFLADGAARARDRGAPAAGGGDREPGRKGKWGNSMKIAQDSRASGRARAALRGRRLGAVLAARPAAGKKAAPRRRRRSR